MPHRKAGAGTPTALLGYRSMTTKEISGQKSAVQTLNFGAKTARRVAWEAWEFTIVGPHQVKVTNASYGHLKDDHAYVVGIEVRDGGPVPAECECPADLYSEEVDCKHKVAVASIGGDIVLEAAREYGANEVAVAKDSPRGVNKLRADGSGDGGSSPFNHDTNDGKDGCDCPTLLGDLPCWECYQAEAQTGSGRV